MPTTAFSIDRVQVRQVLTALQDGSYHRLEELVDFCPDLTQQQIYVAIDYLIQSREICMASQLTREGHAVLSAGLRLNDSTYVMR